MRAKCLQILEMDHLKNNSLGDFLYFKMLWGSSHSIFFIAAYFLSGMARITKWIEKNLGFKVNATKSKVTKTMKLKYLGFRFWKNSMDGK